MITELGLANGISAGGEKGRAWYAEGEMTEAGCVLGGEGSRPGRLRCTTRGLHGRSVGRRRGN